jgi:hypothetical protein
MPKVGPAKFAERLLEVPRQDRQWLELCEEGSQVGVYEETGCEPTEISEVKQAQLESSNE